jgi:hypothetical protein
VADDPNTAYALFRATGDGERGLRADVRIGQHAVTTEEPPALGGGHTAPNPVEYALAALLSCQVVSYRFWAAALDIPLDEVHVDIEGDLDVRGFRARRCRATRVDWGAPRRGPGRPGARRRLRRLRDAVDAHCPVLDLFRTRHR